MSAFSRSESLYKHLNERQRQAVQAFQGPVLVLAGAGSGKTRVLVCRIAALILEKGVSLDNILAVTFTNKAAREMKDRALNLLGRPERLWPAPWLGTFHSVCARLLRQNINLAPDRHSVTIYDQSDQLRLIKKILQDLNIDAKMNPPKSFRQQISLCKRSAVGPNELHRIPQLARDRRFETVYRAYESALREASAFDFESLLLETYSLMDKNPGFLKKLREQFQYICVDEYQDTNRIQYLLIKKLAGGHGNICAVGDEDQSIYGWRGADLNNILDFEKDFRGCRTFFLEENYRSTKNIVLGASSLIGHNKFRKGKVLFTNRSAGEKILVKELASDYEEGRFISQTVRELCANEGAAWDDFAVLYRANAQSRALEDHFRVLQIPYKIVGGLRFYERAEVKDAIAYLKLIANTRDNVSFLRAVNSPRRGIGQASLARLQAFAARGGQSLAEALPGAVRQGIFKGRAAAEAKAFHKLIFEMRGQKDKMPLYDLYIQLLEGSGIPQALKAENTLESQSRIENLQELGNVIEQKSKRAKGSMALEAFLEEMSLLTDEDKTRDRGAPSVTLMTLHSSKGLEFETVFISGMEEGLFPSFQSLEDERLEEERRLAYVGMTRAKSRLILSLAARRRVWGREQQNPPSRFLSEIPQNLVSCQASDYY